MPQITALQIQDEWGRSRTNFDVLWRFNFELGKAIEAQARLPMGYGSEFWKGEVFLLQHHPLWNQMREMLVHGFQWPTEPITKEERVANLIEVLNY
jgi:hypothetical protein